MTVEEMLITIPKLTTREQLLLLEAVSRALRNDIAAHGRERSGEDADDRTAFWASFGAWTETPGEPTLEALVAERRSKSEPPTL